MGEFRIFFHPGATRFDKAIESVVALDERSVATEGEARQLIRALLDAGRDGVSLIRPGNAKPLKGKKLREWLAEAEG